MHLAEELANQVFLNLSLALARDHYEDRGGNIQDGKGDRESEFVDREELRQALERLNPISRNIVIMYYIHGLSHAKIVEVLKLQEGTVRVRLSRALMRLRQIMGKE